MTKNEKKQREIKQHKNQEDVTMINESSRERAWLIIRDSRIIMRLSLSQITQRKRVYSRTGFELSQG